MPKANKIRREDRIPKRTVVAYISDICARNKLRLSAFFARAFRDLRGRSDPQATHAARAYERKGKIPKWLYSFFRLGLHEPLLA